MTTYTRRLTAPGEQALAEVESAARSKVKKATVTRSGDTVTIETKVLWQTQITTITARGGVLEATGNNDEAAARARLLLQAVDHLLDDQGWAKAVDELGTTSVDNKNVRDQVLAVLDADERIVAATQGLGMKKTCILASTQKRIILLERDTIGFGSGSRTISMDKVSAVSANKGMVFGAIEITTSNETIKVEKVAGTEADAFVAAVRHQLDNPAPSVAPEAPAAAPAGGAAAELTKLAELHAAGVLTDEEFAAAKARALGL